MRRVADERAGTRHERARHPLVHVVDLVVTDLVAGRQRRDALEPALHLGGVGRLLVTLPLRDGVDRTPGLGRAQQEEPFLGVGDVVDVGDVRDQGAEVGGGAGDQEPLGVGEPLERHAQQAPCGGAGAVGGDQEAAVQCLGPRGAVPFDHDTVLGDPDRGGLDAVVQCDVGFVHQSLDEHPHQVLLVELEAVRVLRLVLEQCEVELGDQTLLAVAVLVARHREPLGVHLRRQAQLVEQFEGRRMERRGPPVGARHRITLDHTHSHAGPGQGPGRCDTDGATTQDEHRELTMIRHECHSPTLVIIPRLERDRATILV